MPPVTGFLRYLSGWIGIVALMALGNTISCFRGHQFLADRLYTGAPDQVNGLMARLFGVWTLLATFLRLSCAMHINNKPVYNLTFVSFLLAGGHFVSEAFIYKTAPITIGVIAPLAVSGISIIWMLLGYFYLEDEYVSPNSKKSIRDDEYTVQSRHLHQRMAKDPAKDH